MNKYLKLYESHSQYVEPEIKPNVSYCIQEDEIHYNPKQKLIVRYNVTNASNPTKLYTCSSEGGITVNGALMFDKVVIDGTEVSIADLDAANGQTQFSVGEHTAKYTLKDPTFIGSEIDVETGEPTKIGAMFYTCETVSSVEIPNSVTSIGISAFNGCTSLRSVTIPNGVSYIGDYAFENCTSLASVTIPNSVTSIGIEAFSLCESLASVTIPDSVTSIGEKVFYRCTNLTSVTIPNSVTSIGSSAFEDCTGLTSVIVKATTPPELVGDQFNLDVDSLKIYVPSESVNAYKTANGWSEYANNIEPIQ